MSTLGARAGTFATRDGVQIAAVWRMVEKLTKKGSAAAPATIAGPATHLKVVDQSARQAVLRWQAVEGASGYRVYRATGGKTPAALGKAGNQPCLLYTSRHEGRFDFPILYHLSFSLVQLTMPRYAIQRFAHYLKGKS